MRNQPEPDQTNSKKPEWFELLDGDAPSAQVRKVNKKLPIIADLITGAVIASGALFSGASAENSTGQSSVTSTDQSGSSTSSTDANTVTPDPTLQSTTPGTPSVANPSNGLQAPEEDRGRGHDDDGDFDGRERHERGEGRDHDDDD